MISAKTATIYMAGEFLGNIIKTEAKDVSVTRGKYAQYSNAIFITFTPKGKRKPRSVVQTYKPSALILEGFGHPEPASAFKTVSEDDSVTVKSSVYRSFDDGWRRDFDSMIAQHIEKTSAVILADFRGVRTE